MTDDDSEPSGRVRSGLARAAALTPEARSAIAKRAAEKRWSGDAAPEAIRDGILKIGEAEFQCFVLADHTRVLARASFVRAIGRTGKVKGGREYDGELQTPVFLTANNLKPFFPSDLEGNSKPILLKHKGVDIISYRAELLPAVCDVFADALAAGALRKNQIHIAEQCRILSRGLTRVGIIGLVDEATGFQEVRDRQALQEILNRYLRKELAAWAHRFPDDFYKEIFRLRNWEWKGMKVNRPQVVANYTKDFVYERLAPGILEELEKRNPKTEKGYRKGKHHQLLTDDVGHPALAQHLHTVIAFMRASSTWAQFKHLLDKALPKKGNNLELDV